MGAQHLDSYLLTQCLRRGPDVGLHSKLRGINVETWRELVDRAAWHGVAPLLYHRLGLIENLVIPPEQFARLRDLYVHCLLMNRVILEQLSEIVRETTGAGCSVLFLKGAYLAHCVYEEAALRPTGDIDLLAPAHDAERVQRLLKTLGYRYAAGTEAIDYSRLHHLRPVSRVDSVNIEVHHDLAPTGAPFVHDIVGLWGRSTRTRVGDLDLPHPAPDDLLLHVCTHAAYNDEFRLGLAAVCDIDAVVHRLGHQLDWERLIQTANSDGRSHFVYAALRLAQVLLETPISENVVASLDHDQADDEVLEAVVVYVLSTAETLPTTLRSMGEVMTASDKLKTLWRGLFPPPQTLRRIYRLRPGTKLQFLYYVVRPLDLLLRRGRKVLGFLIRSPRSKPAREKERHRRMIRAWAQGKASF
ncbi:MAG: nucleotidyltransferase family protein [Gemmatimonadetes bacterium]|nr:nucleotidyltransferase family protein [Gemmatimonadota bacterium]